MINMLLIQALGAIGYTFLGLSYFKKNKLQILFMQIISYIFFIIHFYLLNGISGVICNLIQLCALVTIYIFEKHNLKNKIPIAILFISMIIISNLILSKSIFSIFPVIATSLVIISFLKNDENIIRKIGVLSIICWTIYAITCKSYVTLIFEIYTLITIIISITKNASSKPNKL